jgi:hypothetical protein
VRQTSAYCRSLSPGFEARRVSRLLRSFLAAEHLNQRSLAPQLLAGAIASELTYEHVLAISGARKGKEIRLPGQVTAYGEGEWRILFKPTPPMPGE